MKTSPRKSLEQVGWKSLLVLLHLNNFLQKVWNSPLDIVSATEVLTNGVAQPVEYGV